jgi:hypothetical protein
LLAALKLSPPAGKEIGGSGALKAFADPLFYVPKKGDRRLKPAPALPAQAD